jgi:hypothetical protein
MTIERVQNANDDGSVPDGVWCGRCCNEGVVMLEGTVQVGGREYSRGSAPCKWCAQGALRHDGWSAPSGAQKGKDNQGRAHTNRHRQVVPAEDYSMFDVYMTAQPGRGEPHFIPDAEFLAAREAAGCSRASLQAMFPRRIWPAHWDQADPRRPHLLGGFDRELPPAEAARRAAEALNRANREQEEAL